MSQPFPAPDHDHANCMTEALSRAEQLCRQRGVRLTQQRKRVLEIVWEHHAPIGAYEILERLAESGNRPAPITVYRALEFLLAQGLAHRIATRNAYVGCSTPDAVHGRHFLICRSCQGVAELKDQLLEQAIAESGSRRGFFIENEQLEMEGLCSHCQADREQTGE